MTTECIEDLGNIKAVATFLSFFMDQAGFHDFASDMTKDDYRGMSRIMAWMGDQIEACEVATRERLKQSDLDLLKRLGLPLEALADERLQGVWRVGFSHGLAHAEKEA